MELATTQNTMALFEGMQPLELGLTTVNDKDYAGLSGEFLPRIMLMQPGSGPVSNGKASFLDFVLVGGDKDNPKVLGKAFDALVIQIRPKAMHLEGPTIVDDVYDVNDPVYQRIKADSAKKSDTDANMFGAEFLLWLLKEKQFCVYFFSNTTLRKEIPTVKSFLQKTVTFNSRKIGPIKGKTWAGMFSHECATPYSEGPDIEALKMEIQKFQNPVTKKREAAPVKLDDRR